MLLGVICVVAITCIIRPSISSEEKQSMIVIIRIRRHFAGISVEDAEIALDKLALRQANLNNYPGELEKVREAEQRSIDRSVRRQTKNLRKRQTKCNKLDEELSRKRAHRIMKRSIL